MDYIFLRFCYVTVRCCLTSLLDLMSGSKARGRCVCRNTGAGLGSFAGRFGGILYPYINYLSKTNAGGRIGRQLPLVIFGVLSIVGGFLALHYTPFVRPSIVSLPTS